VIWRGFGVCLVECMASLIESFERSSVGPYLTPSEGCRQRLPSTAGIVCGGAIDGSPRVAPTSRPTPPIYKLEALPADGMGATAAEWRGLRHAPVAALRQTYAASHWKGRGRLLRPRGECEEIPSLSGVALRTAWEARTAGMGRLQTHACSKKPVTRSPRRRARAASAADQVQAPWQS
jgi:hypothetical protein